MLFQTKTQYERLSIRYCKKFNLLSRYEGVVKVDGSEFQFAFFYMNTYS